MNFCLYFVVFRYNDLVYECFVHSTKIVLDIPPPSHGRHLVHVHEVVKVDWRVVFQLLLSRTSSFNHVCASRKKRWNRDNLFSDLCSRTFWQYNCGWSENILQRTLRYSWRCDYWWRPCREFSTRRGHLCGPGGHGPVGGGHARGLSLCVEWEAAQHPACGWQHSRNKPNEDDISDEELNYMQEFDDVEASQDEIFENAKTIRKNMFKSISSKIKKEQEN